MLTMVVALCAKTMNRALCRCLLAPAMWCPYGVVTYSSEPTRQGLSGQCRGLQYGLPVDCYLPADLWWWIRSNHPFRPNRIWSSVRVSKNMLHGAQTIIFYKTYLSDNFYRLDIDFAQSQACSVLTGFVLRYIMLFKRSKYARCDIDVSFFCFFFSVRCKSLSNEILQIVRASPSLGFSFEKRRYSNNLRKSPILL